MIELCIDGERTVFFDMDNTSFGFDGAVLESMPKILRLPRKEFYIAKDYPEAQRPEIEAVYNHPDFFGNLQPIPGFMETWQRMIDMGFHPQILSSPIPSNPRSVEGKIESLQKHMVPEFGESVVDEAIFDRDKWKYKGLIIFDDRPDLPRGPEGQDIADWDHVLFGWEHLPIVPLATTSLRLVNWRYPDQAVRFAQDAEERRLSGL